MVESYSKADRDADEEARGSVALIAVGVLLYGLLAFALDNVAAGPAPAPSGTRMLHSLTDVVDGFVQLGANDPLTVILSILGIEVALAIAQTATALDPAATPRTVVATERWLNSLRGCTYILASSVCLVAVGSIMAIIKQHQVPGSETIVLVSALAAGGLASALIDRSDALIAQVGLLVQRARTDEAIQRLTISRPTPRVALIRVAAAPVAAVLLITSGVDYGLHRNLVRLAGGAVLAAVAFAWLAFSVWWARWGLGRQAMQWAYGKRHSGVRLVVYGYSTIFFVALGWSLLAIPLAWWFVRNVTGFFVLFGTILLWPVMGLARDGAPRVRLRGRDRKPRPTSTSVDRATCDLQRRRSDLDVSLAKWEARASELPFVSGGGPSR